MLTGELRRCGGRLCRLARERSFSASGGKRLSCFNIWRVSVFLSDPQRKRNIEFNSFEAMLPNQRWKVCKKRKRLKCCKQFQPSPHTKLDPTSMFPAFDAAFISGVFMFWLKTLLPTRLEEIKLLLDGVPQLYTAFMWNNHSITFLCFHIYIYWDA